MKALIEPQFQSILTVRDQSLYAVEALFRFKGQNTLPARHFQKWERTGYIKYIDIAVLQTVAELVAKYKFADRVAVNVSARTIEDASEEYFRELLALAGKLPRLIVEVTETYAITNCRKLIAFSKMCAATDIHVCLDDCAPPHQFCDGKFIKAVRPKLMKIDAEVITRAFDTGAAHELDPLRGLVQRAKEAGAGIVAEGVDSPGKLDFVRTLGIDYWQGFHADKPRLMATFPKKVLVRAPSTKALATT